MTTKDKITAIERIIGEWSLIVQGNSQIAREAALGTVTAIKAITELETEDDREAAISNLDRVFGIGGDEQRSAASAAFDKMMFGDNGDV